MIPVRASWRERLLSPLGILAIAATLRVTLVLVMGQHVWFADTNEYAELARWMMHGQGFPPGSSRAPLFPALLAIAFWLGGDGNWVVAGLLNVIPALALVGVTMRIGTWIGGAEVGRMAGLLTAVMPMQVFTTALLYPTTLYALSLACMAWATLEIVGRPAVWKGVALGVALVGGWLADQVIVAPAAAVSAWLVWHVRERGAALARALLLAIVVAVAIAAPYVSWRRSAFQANAEFMNKAQFVQYYGRSDPSTNRNRWLRLPEDSTWQALPMQAYVRQELRFLRTRPVDYVHDYSFEVIHFWNPLAHRIQTRNAFTSGALRWFGAIVFIPIILLQWVGVFGGRAPQRERLLLILIPVASALFYGFFFTQARYRAPSEPLMLVLASLGFQRLFPRATAVVFGSRGDPAA